MIDAAKLREIADEIDLRLGEQESPRAIAEDLAERFGRRWESGGTVNLRLAKVAVSCTSGEPQILRAWIRKARALIEEAGL
jgi:hypothetical protein